MEKSKKPTVQQIESHHFNLDMMDLEFDAVLHVALLQVKNGTARPFYEFKDGIEDADHLTHITIKTNDGDIIYDQDFELEKAILKQVDRQDN